MRILPILLTTRQITTTRQMDPFPALEGPSCITMRSASVLEISDNINAECGTFDVTLNTLPVPVRPPDRRPASTLRLTLTILQLSLVNLLSSFTNGIITVGLPTIAQFLFLPRSLYLWPSSVYSLTCGSILLIAGSLADLLGSRNLELLGILVLGLFTLACGLSSTGVQLVIFRALQGVAMGIHLPASVALVAREVPEGRPRNVGFACLGLSQPLGFSIGLVASGIMIERAGWRLGFYVSGGILVLLAGAALWMLPKVELNTSIGMVKKALLTKVDWVGSALASGGLALMAYVLA